MFSAAPWLTAIDLIGTFVFAVSGATLGVRRQLDLFGVLVLSVAAATAGGIIRDVMIGAVPPASLVNWEYLAVATLAGVVTFAFAEIVERVEHPVRLFDAAGLGLFAVAGTAKALDFGLAAPSAVLLGTLSGIGGGIVRDIMVAQVPTVLRSELYASAAIVGGICVTVAVWLQLPRGPAMVVGAVLCFVLRFMAIRYRWGLPVARARADGSDD
ncbi:MAG: trimeric intracellular cation channel family protein [Pseudomonadota bacterium]